MRDSLEFTKEFIALVKQFPCLYDKTHPDYSIRGPTQQVWAQIGEKVKEKPTDCSVRWKNLRHSYHKYQQKLQLGSEGKPFKEYYLANHLCFLDPFLKSRQKKDTAFKLPTKEDTVDSISPEWDANNINSDSESGPGVACQTPCPVLDRKKSPPSPTRDYVPTKRKRSVDVSKSSKYFEKSTMEETGVATRQLVDPDLAFLQSLLPDMRLMNAKTKRKFKMEVLQLADQLLTP